MRILVTGGAGFIGSHLVDALASDDHNDIVILDDLSSGSRGNLLQHTHNPRVRIVEADIRNPASLVEPMRGIEVVYHLAVQCLRLSIRDPLLVHEVNATGTLNLLCAAREAGISRFIYCSSSEVYGTATRLPMDEEHTLIPTTPYGASKLAGEVYARSFYTTYGLPVIVVRAFNAYGPREQLKGPSGEVIPKMVARAMSNAPLVIFGDGDQTRDFTHVGDTARGLIMAGKCDALFGDAVNIACGHEVSLNSLARMILERVPTSRSTIEHHANRPGDIRRQHADISKAQRLLGFEPRVDIGAGLSQYIDWVMNQDVSPDQLLAGDQLRNWE